MNYDNDYQFNTNDNDHGNYYQNNNNHNGNDNDNEVEGKIKNQSSIELELCGKKHTIKSNEVEADIINITIKKEQSCAFVFVGDKIKYTIKICNDSNVNLYGIEFKDCYSECTKYVKNSFKVKDKKENPDIDDHTIKFIIPELKAKEEITVTFEVEIE